MPPPLALLICIIFTLLLLAVEKKLNPSASSTLWLPTLWLLYCGSSPVGFWLQQGGTDIETGSPYDRLFLGTLILFSIILLKKRGIRWLSLFAKYPILAFPFILAGLSILWSDFPFLSIKRWIRLAGIIPLGYIILSESKPAQALESILRRCAYVLIPLSIVLIKYYPHLGRQYHRWSGAEMWTGVTLTKNMLGQLCAFSAFYFCWFFFRQLKTNTLPNVKLGMLTDGCIVAMALYLLAGSDSMTSLAALIIGVPTMLLLYSLKKTWTATKLLIAGIVLTWILFIAGGPLVAEITQAFGRDSSFTNRTEFWPLLLAAGARHPVFGAGFGGYFNVPGNEFLEQYGINWAHNGLLAVYVELGLLGVFSTIILYLYLFRLFGKCPANLKEFGLFGICLLLMSWLIGFSENLFLQSSSFPWSLTVFFAIVFSEPASNMDLRVTNS